MFSSQKHYDLMLEIICENFQDKKFYFPSAVSLKEICETIKPQLQHKVLGALVNNKVRELTYILYKPKRICFFDITNSNGFQMYSRSLCFLFYKALKDVYPQSHLIIHHSISGGRYCEILNIDEVIDNNFISRITKRIKELIALDIPFIRKEMLTAEAIKIYEKNNLHEKTLLFKYRGGLYTSVYSIENTVNYYYGYLVPSTGYIDTFNLQKYYDGVILQPPSRTDPYKCSEVQKQEKLFSIFQESKRWGTILGISYIGDLNRCVENKTVSNLIKVSEALHEKKIAQIADEIHKRKNVKIILVGGPSSSGKTTFAKRLAIQLEVLSLKSIMISMDNYFVERKQTPVDETGNYNFECPEAIDIKLFNNHLKELLAGKKIKMCVFDFAYGKKKYTNQFLCLAENQIIIIEGLHALNPVMSAIIDDKYKFRIFVSALTQISIDMQNPIHTADNRLIRRIIRDYLYRGYSALQTIRRWQSVRNGEENFVFPFQENADIMFNSAILCELGVLKTFAEPIIQEVPENEPEFSEAVRLLKFLSYFNRIPESEIPPTSILREFFGGSSFIY